MSAYPNAAINGINARRRQWLQGLSLLALPVATFDAALAGYNFFTSSYTLSKEDLQARLDTRFPMQLGAKELVALELTAPLLSLDAKTNRVMITAKMGVTSGLFKPQRMAGTLGISSALKYDAAAQSILLDQPSTDRLDMDGLSERGAELLTRMGTYLIRQALQDQPLYVFKPEQLKFGFKTYEPSGIKVVEDGIAVTVK